MHLQTRAGPCGAGPCLCQERRGRQVRSAGFRLSPKASKLETRDPNLCYKGTDKYFAFSRASVLQNFVAGATKFCRVVDSTDSSPMRHWALPISASGRIFAARARLRL